MLCFYYLGLFFVTGFDPFLEQVLDQYCLCLGEQIFIGWIDFLKKTIKKKNENRLLMFQTNQKLIKPSWSNRTTIGRKTDPNRYALVLIITKPIPISLVTNLKKNRANQTAHTPSLYKRIHGGSSVTSFWNSLFLV